jgi:hypothetical protein
LRSLRLRDFALNSVDVIPPLEVVPMLARSKYPVLSTQYAVLILGAFVAGCVAGLAEA